MHYEILVEEPSAEAALRNIIPKIIGNDHSFQIHSSQGKTDLLSNLPNRLKGYSKWILQDWRIIVLIDNDRNNCLELKKRLECIAKNAGLNSKSNPDNQGNYAIINRIAIEELEAWFLGDPDAIRFAYNRVAPNFEKKAKYRIPDAIKGGTWEALERLLRLYGYYKSGLPKIEAARNISLFMVPIRNRSKSFQVFRDAMSL